MGEKHVIKFAAIMRFFNEEERLVERGENAVASGHVCEMTYKEEIRMLSGVVHASMRDRKYKVEINFNSDWEIVSAVCSCPRGQFLCHHMTSLAIFGHYNLSVTDTTRTWSVPKGSTTEVQTLQDLYPPSKSHRSTERDVTESEISAFLQKLQVFEGAVGFTWLLAEDNATTTNLIVNVEDIIFCEAYLTSANKREYVQEQLHLTKEVIAAVAAETAGQYKNEKWLVYRKHRLTASNFGVVLSACHRKRYPPSLFRRLSGSYNMDHIRAIQWGREHEAEAIKAFTDALNLEVTMTGLWLHECGYLGASPDGLVGENALLEVKCPYKYREASLMEGIKEDSNYIITADHAGNVSINKRHEYYQQIQGQLCLLKRQLCHLVIWTPKEVVIVSIEAEDFTCNIDTLKDFYLNHYIKFITGEKYCDS